MPAATMPPTTAPPTTAPPTTAPPTTAPPTLASPTNVPPGGAPSPVVPSLVAPGGQAPTRDELTKAWGDTIFGRLPRAAQIYLANGRFVKVNGLTAELALPDAGFVSRAARFIPDVESALAAHFGKPVRLQLTVDSGAIPGEPSDGASGPEEEYTIDDLSELADATDVADIPIEQRILQAFPGSVLDE